MSHPLLKTAIRFFFIAIFLLVPAKIASACNCASRPTVLEAYEAADEVLIVRVVSLQAVGEAPEALQYFDITHLATVVVERIYKGNLNVNDRLVFGLGGGIGCPWSFGDTIDKQFLLYLKTPKKPDDLWFVPFCTRSNDVARAREDLLYLDNRQKVRGKTRVSGNYRGSSDSDLDVANRKIRISSDQRVYETNTDEKGVFEIYDLPPGNYRFEPEIPAGWKIAGFWPRSKPHVSWKRATDGSMHFVLEPKKHASINVTFRLGNSVEGTIVGPTGNPVIVCARLWTPDQERGNSANACSDHSGRFRFESVPPGSYLMVINPSGEPSSAEPFPRLFYPGTQQREKAALITVAAGETLRNINMVVPTMLETVTVEGVLYFSDDQPARQLTVRFLPAVRNGIDGYTQADTDENGRFSLKVIKGLSGKISSAFFGSPGTFEDCPEFDALVKGSTENPPQVPTPAIAIEAEQDIQNLVLRFPFPTCKVKE